VTIFRTSEAEHVVSVERVEGDQTSDGGGVDGDEAQADDPGEDQP
jgi:hypothetical protein